MNLPSCYYGTPFSQEQVARMKCMLGLESEAETIHVAVWIATTAWICTEEDAARQRTPEIKTAKKRLDRIASVASLLAQLMEDEPIAEHLVRIPGTLQDRAVDGEIDLPAIRDEDQKKLRDFIGVARTIRIAADHYLADDQTLRFVYHLPPRSGVGKSPVALWLWPALFEIWEDCGNKVAKTPAGPLHRFVSFVHEACGFPEVKASTFKDAVTDWKQNEQNLHRFEHPPWRIVVED
jgi:hypothetical protein